LNQLTAGNIIVTAPDESTVAPACKKAKICSAAADRNIAAGCSDDARSAGFAAQ
jgi:hypothetical protein